MICVIYLPDADQKSRRISRSWALTFQMTCAAVFQGVSRRLKRFMRVGASVNAMQSKHVRRKIFCCLFSVVEPPKGEELYVENSALANMRRPCGTLNVYKHAHRCRTR